MNEGERYKMFVTYNPTGIGNVLILPLKQGNINERTYETFGDVVKITDESGDIYGYNIFNISTYMSIGQTGHILITGELINEIEQVFQKNGLADQLNIDTTPKFVIGHVLERDQHPNADKLSVCQVDIGEETVQIVCGAANVAAGQKVVVAKVGATMPDGLKIKASKLRGEDSHGMICSRKELGLPEDPKEQGIYVLDDAKTAGEPFEF